MKKILLFTRPIAPPWDEGSKNLAWEIAKKSSSDNLKFSVLTPKDNLDFLTEHKNVQPKKIYSSSRFSIMEKIKLFKYFFSLKTGDFDVIHFLFTPRLLTSNLISAKLKKLGPKTIQTIATLNEKDYENSTKLKKILFADKIIAQSNYTFNRLKDTGFGNVALIYPSINLDYFRPKEKNLELQKNLNIEANDFVMLFAGEFTRLNAIDDVIETMCLLSSQAKRSEDPGSNEKNKILNQIQNDNAVSESLNCHPRLERGSNEDTLLAKNNFKLIIACRIKNKQDTIKKKEIKAKIKKLNLEKNIVVLQKTVELLDYYNLIDLSIFPVQKMAGKFDIPLVLAESMACGKPVLASNLPVLKEFIKEDETGYISPVSNPKKLAEKIAEIISQPEKLKTISQNALAYAQENFDIKTNAKKYEEVYKSL